MLLNMKLIITIAIFFLGIFSSFSQSLTLSEISKMSQMNLDSFDSYVSSKGYVFTNKDKIDGESFYQYGNKEKYELEYKRVVMKVLGKTQIISFSTMFREDYVNIKNEINDLGYVYEGIEDSDNKTSNTLKYRNGNRLLKISSESNMFHITLIELPQF